MLIDLIAAHPDDAQAILRTSGHANVWPTLETPGIGPMQLASLSLVLSGRAPAPAAQSRIANDFTKLASDGDEGPWIHRMPDELLALLAHLEEHQLDDMAQAWAGADEQVAHRWGGPGLPGLLAELSALAGSALAQGHSILVWVCP